MAGAEVHRRYPNNRACSGVTLRVNGRHVFLGEPRAQGVAITEVEQLTMSFARIILSQMENSQDHLDRTFAALADPTRRAILGRLARRTSASVSELAEPFAIKLPAVMKHLGVLDKANLITRSKSGRVVTIRLRPESMREAMAWLHRQERFWSGRLDKLTAYAERKELEARSKKQ
jgi:DNA-binding transcriptional ArsR family regulator